MKHVLTIAGSDSCGCAGIQADLKTMTALGVFGMSAITAITVQNTREVRAVHELPPEIVTGQIDAVFDDIAVDAVKVGMVANAAVARAIREALDRRRPANVVVDPVMVSKSGCRLLSDGAVQEIMRLVASASLVTPNMPEAELMSGMKIRDRADMPAAARAIRAKGAVNVLVKGGRLTDSADDLLLLDDREIWLNCPRIPTRNVNGTGCTLSSAIACGLAKGHSVEEAVREGKRYVTEGIRFSLDIGQGPGPLGHFAAAREISAL